MSATSLEIHIADAVATVTLNRPDVRNAFNETMIAELAQCFSDLGQNKAVRVIILTAKGSAFCAGADLHWMQKMANYTLEENRSDAAQLASMLHTIYTCPKPVIAKVQGDCYAGGMGLVAVCDIAVSVDSAQFCLSEVKLGLIPATISPYVVRAIGDNAARRYFLTAERFTATAAHRLGLVHECVVASELDNAVISITQALLTNGPHAVMQAKALVCQVSSAPIDANLIASTVEQIAQTRASDEGREGVKAFLEKRKPGWVQ